MWFHCYFDALNSLQNIQSNLVVCKQQLSGVASLRATWAERLVSYFSKAALWDIRLLVVTKALFLCLLWYWRTANRLIKLFYLDQGERRVTVQTNLCGQLWRTFWSAVIGSLVAHHPLPRNARKTCKAPSYVCWFCNPTHLDSHLRKTTAQLSC